MQYKGSLKAVTHLSDAQPVNQLLDSVLEKRFVEALRREHSGTTFKLSELLFKGKAGYQLLAGSRRWRVELQVSLGASDGVMIPCKPDFVFWPDDAVDDLPIAVFVDGWQYHKDIISTDLGKRMAIAKSGKYSVWTLTWEDIEQVLQSKPQTSPSPWTSLLATDSQGIVQKLCAAQGIAELADFPYQAPFSQLHRRLMKESHRDLCRLAVVLGASMLMPPGDEQALQTVRAGAFWKRLEELGLLSDLQGTRMSVRQLGTVFGMVTAMHSDQLKQVMKGQCLPELEPLLVGEWLDHGLPESERQLRWQQLWQLLNLLLPLRRLWFGEADMNGLGALQDSPALKSQSSDLPGPWTDVMDLAAAAVHDWLMALVSLGIKAPEVGYELMDERGRVLAEAELAWPSIRVAILLPGAEDGTLFSSHGWHIFTVAEGELPSALRILLMETLA